MDCIQINSVFVEDQVMSRRSCLRIDVDEDEVFLKIGERRYVYPVCSDISIRGYDVDIEQNLVEHEGTITTRRWNIEEIYRYVKKLKRWNRWKWLPKFIRKLIKLKHPRGANLLIEGCNFE